MWLFKNPQKAPPPPAPSQQPPSKEKADGVNLEEDDDEDSSSDSDSEEDMMDTEVPHSDVMENDFVVDLICRLMAAPVIQDPLYQPPSGERTTSCSEDETSKSRRRTKLVPTCADVKISKNDYVRMCRLSRKSLLKQSSLIELDEKKLPITVCGDIHGNFLHFRKLLLYNGPPSLRTYLFLGDYVDRGVQGIECFTLLMALQYRYPTKVFLLRGNHEDANTTVTYGFYDECLQKFPTGQDGDLVWRHSMDVFSCLSVAAMINGTIMSMHGGLSPHMESLSDIQNVHRPCIIPPFGVVCDLLWSDPMERDQEWALSHRGISFTFGTSIIDQFCEKFAVDLIIRGHQIVTEMYRYGFKMFPSGRLVTIFSSMNYLNYRNNASVTNVSRKMKVQFVCFRCRRYTSRNKAKKSVTPSKAPASTKEESLKECC